MVESALGSMLGHAGQLQKSRHFEESSKCYAAIANEHPDCAAAWHGWGIVLSQLNQCVDGIQKLKEAVRLQPENAAWHNNLGMALKTVGDLRAAKSSFARAVVIRPDYSVALVNLGMARLETGEAEAAVDTFEQALRFNRQDAGLYIQIARALGMLGRHGERIENLKLAIRLQENLADAHVQLGHAFYDVRKFENAVESLQRGVEIRPNDAGAWASLALALLDDGDDEEALKAAAEALRQNPDLAQACNVMGRLHHQRGDTDKAIPHLKRALALQPDLVSARNNYGICQMQQSNHEEALRPFEMALTLKPDQADSHFNRSLVWLAKGDFRHGWTEYEWRWLRPQAPPRPTFPCRRWDGQPLNGEKILLHSEQGLGDTLQYVRFAQSVEDKGGKVVLACQKRLVPLLSSTPGVDEIHVMGSDLSARFQVYAPLMSVPALLRLDESSIPNPGPYVAPDPQRVERWKEWLSSFEGFRIGIAWQGNSKFNGDRLRSVALQHFEKVASVPGVRLFSLQRGEGCEQIEKFRTKHELIELPSGVDDDGAFVDTAAVIQGLDLVISSDTALPHLAGALGIPVWMVLSKNPDWRWLRDKTDSPWYPSMRLFRQQHLGDWAPVFDDVASELANHPDFNSHPVLHSLNESSQIQHGSIPLVPQVEAAVASSHAERKQPPNGQPPSEISVAVLCYGPHTDLARRCLNSILETLDEGQHHVSDFRIGLNAVINETAAFVDEWAQTVWESWRIPVIIYRCETNALKYPLMRRMLHDVDREPAELIMWFDDDSYLEPTSGWWQRVRGKMDEHDLVGQVNKERPMHPNQWEWIQQQAWLNPAAGEPPYDDGQRQFRFCQGRWWVIRREAVRGLDWPIRQLRHTGGDTLLGEMCRHFNLGIGHFVDKVRINANDKGEQSKAPRRGHDEPDFGIEYRPDSSQADSLPHHDFKCIRTTVPTDHAAIDMVLQTEKIHDAL